MDKEDLLTTVDQLRHVAYWSNKQGNYDASNLLAHVAGLLQQMCDRQEQLLGRIRVLEEECNWLETKNRAAHMGR